MIDVDTTLRSRVQTEPSVVRETNATAASPYDRSYYYGAAYRDYDKQNPPHKLRYYARTLVDAMRSVDRPHVLDIGCAMGYVLRYLPSTWARTGLDASGYAIDEARRALPDATFIQATQPPAEGRFDLITAFDVIEHVIEYRTMIASIDHILAPAGKVAFVVPVFDGPLGLVVHALDYDVTHHNKWARQTWLDLVSETFEIESWTGIFRYLTPAGYVHFGTDALRGCAPAIFVVAKKREIRSIT